jgi:hypothetical protein
MRQGSFAPASFATFFTTALAPLLLALHCAPAVADQAADFNLAMERGEVGGRGSNSWESWKSTRPQWLRDKLIHVLVQIGLKRHPQLPDVPLMLELGRTEDDRNVLAFIPAPRRSWRASNRNAFRRKQP